MAKRNAKELSKDSKQIKYENESKDSVCSEEEFPLDDNSPRQKKKSFEAQETGLHIDFNQEVVKLLECFGADINKALLAKRRRLEDYTQNSFRITSRKVLETMKLQMAERKRLMEEFRKQLSTFVQQSEMDLEKSKSTEEKLQRIILQQQKYLQKMREARSEKLKALTQLGDQFFKGFNDLDIKHADQFTEIQADFRKEMEQLQKKILMDTQQQEMLNVRKNLQTMLL